VPVFHYALQLEGLLLLGPIENVASYSNLFRVIERKHHIYQAQRTAVRQMLEFPLAALAAAARRDLGSEPARTPREHGALRALEHLLLESFAPASAVINERGDVAYFWSRLTATRRAITAVPQQPV
jgi:two-component system CheB/CheR fusion protein